MKFHAFFFILVLTGCAPSTVHLHSYKVPEAEKNEIVTALEATGLKVLISERKPPLVNMGSFIIYPKDDGDNDDLVKILNIINEKGYTTGLIAKNRVKNHEYRNSNNIGLYLVNSDGLMSMREQLAAEFAVDITEVEFSSTNCTEAYKLSFDKDGSARINDISLLWSKNEDTVVLSHQNQSQKFTYSNKYERNGATRELVMQLVPYRNNTLDSIKYFNCKYQSRTPLIE
ncbi:hypothetical protein N476_19625 [Pseudoalteromonas luteoviolacea H33]|uniref:Lipoprotein n=2 Tax=Pseudoalteromonas luteoviolacea TaxID=43657 RepID=A0A167DRP8_9GAMM|nr:hypothetical protein N476_19625 [Pseudoalteromonas luteoviolacea H33]KZN74937.1 hypothetical protein N477_21165 [Pseudoalteromonas luteoviolacea H33-S]